MRQSLKTMGSKLAEAEAKTDYGIDRPILILVKFQL